MEPTDHEHPGDPGQDDPSPDVVEEGSSVEDDIDMDGAASAGDPTRSRPASDLALGVVVDLAVLGIALVASFATYLFVILPFTADREQERDAVELAERWSGVGEIDMDSGEQAAPFDPYAFSDDYGQGETFAKIRIPALGEDWEYTMAVGTSLDDLRTSPGWYETTQLPGEPGNFATAAHRDGSNAPYMHMDKLEVCDDIIIETLGGMWVYTVFPTDMTSQEQWDRYAECAPNAARAMAETDLYDEVLGSKYIVDPTAVDVTFPIPGAGMDTEYLIPEQSHPLMTMTSCHPRWQNHKRIIVHAALDRSYARS